MGSRLWTASMALNSWERAWTVLLFPGPGAWIRLEPDFGISSPDWDCYWYPGRWLGHLRSHPLDSCICMDCIVVIVSIVRIPVIGSDGYLFMRNA